ncbi:MAG TPA: hypothetical protein VMX76_03845 [Nevskiaceae bacterium]|nr:hypothetical protein [Nevskiaceae bacterium]
MTAEKANMAQIGANKATEVKIIKEVMPKRKDNFLIQIIKFLSQEP